MNVLLICFLLVLPFYLLLWLINGDEKDFVVTNSIEPISVVIPFRNEAGNLQDLRNCIEQLKTMPGDEVILVNDHSSDKGELMLQNLPQFCKLIHLNPQQRGSKKEALTLGIDNSKNKWILTTDADCLFSSEWLYSWRNEISDKRDFVCGPVQLTEANFSILRLLTEAEHVALQIFTKASIVKNTPMLSNGSNLLFNKNIWNSIGGYKNHTHLASGDDVLFMRDVISNRGSISYASTVGSLVRTMAVDNVNEWFNQRLRWMSKSSHLVGLNTRMHALLIVFWVFSFPMGLLVFKAIYLFFLIPELLIVRYLSPYKVNLSTFLIWPFYRLLYPFLVLALIILKFFYKPSWKGRPIRAEA